MSKARFGNGRYFLEFEAAGRRNWRLGKELHDGRTVWLDFAGSDAKITGKDFAHGERLKVRLANAVAAARYWKREAQSLRRPNPLLGAGLGGIGMGGLAAMWLLMGKKQRGGE